LAVCLPAIVVIVFAAIESCSMIFVTQALHAATYEGARVAIQRSSTTAQTTQRAQEVIAGYSFTGVTVTCQPSDVSTVQPGQTITVIATVSCEANRISPAFFFSSRNLEARTTMVKEG
jgi:hypothetical protein